MRRAYDASRLDFPQRGQKFRGGYGIDRFGADEREKGSFQPPIGRVRIARRPFGLLAFNPFHRHQLKGILCKLLVQLSLSGRVDTVLNGFSGVGGFFPCFFQGCCGIGAERNQLFLALKMVFQPPAFCAARRDEQVQPFGVKGFLLLFSRIGGADCGIGQRHGVVLLCRFVYGRRVVWYAFGTAGDIDIANVQPTEEDILRFNKEANSIAREEIESARCKVRLR